MPANPEGLLPVEQRHREAAAHLVEWQQKATAEWGQNGKPAWSFFAFGFAAEIRKGIWDDHEIVQAFARFEQSLRPAATEERREARSVDQIVDEVTTGFRQDVERIMSTVPTDYRLNLATALFEAAYRQNLRAWSDETRDYWLAKADRALALSPTTAPIDQAQGVGDG